MRNKIKLAGILLSVYIGFAFSACEMDIFGSGDPGINAAELVSKMTIGWNLGNTLDAHYKTEPNASHTVSQMERAWISARTTQTMVDTIKNAGFNTIRIPVTWYKAADADGNIRADWMARVKEIVDYGITAGMFVILNSHHDEYVYNTALTRIAGIFGFKNEAEKNESIPRFQKIWGQIAKTFKDYDERLIFEGLNEPRVQRSSLEWSGGTAEERAILNEYYQVFVDTVRKSGGKNHKRILMINTYGASASANAVNGLVLPADPTPDRLIVSVHFYSPSNFALTTGSGAVAAWDRNSSTDTSPITGNMNRVHTAFVSKGIPVIIGEFGAMNRNNEKARADWADFYVSNAREKGIKCVWWDNGLITSTDPAMELFGIINRTNYSFPFPVLLDSMLKAAGAK